MHAGCPQMTILPSNAGLPQLDGVYGPISMRADLYPGETPARWARLLDEWCAERGFDPATQTSVNLFRCLWEFDLMAEAHQLRRSLGRTLQFRADVRRLAALTVYRLSQRFGLALDPRDRLHRGAFLGAHLRTSADAEKAGWLNDAAGSFDGQTDAQLALAAAANLSVVYVATGNAVDLARFAVKAWERGRVNVTSKAALLTGADLDELNALSWDQQALVDYEVLLKCSRFAGFTKSSYSWNIAIRRNLVGQEWNRIEGVEVKEDPYKVLQEEEEVAFDDGLSRLGGHDGWHEMKIPKGMWP
ncbi:hypothetical protein AOQ84DRAFT_333785 [Glonium stellatum]|uniref:Uncharacterized protein n=1 Tax=Glonium stellatum TaxID=574774 RepID=A0A8E2JX01_9PEZI|nr:hypothetical protein AOQ84DRAFT_333785 [Glonium stellatum]